MLLSKRCLILGWFFTVAVISAGCRDESSDTGPMVEIVVKDSKARSCDVVISENGSKVDRVTFPDDVTGSYQHRSPILAVSFFTKEHRAFEDASATLSLIDEEAIDEKKRLSLVRGSCYDENGAAIPSAKIEIIEK